MGNAECRSRSEATSELAFQDSRVRSHTLRAEPECAKIARDLAKAALIVWDLYSLAGDVEVVVEELFANAWRHGCAGREHAEVRLILRHEGDHVYVGMWDPSLVIPRPLANDPYALKEEGRGLCMVAAFAQTYGFTPQEDGKVSWATFKI
jgi:anti-sigma regulatory factor (Ser/Thr protein kinase)